MSILFGTFHIKSFKNHFHLEHVKLYLLFLGYKYLKIKTFYFFLHALNAKICFNSSSTSPENCSMAHFKEVAPHQSGVLGVHGTPGPLVKCNNGPKAE